jgi:hypothetical protein
MGDVGLSMANWQFGEAGRRNVIRRITSRTQHHLDVLSFYESGAPTQIPTQLAPTGPKNRGLRRRRSIET